MSTNIRFKRSDIPGKVPSLDSIDLGELALNTADGKLFTKQEIKAPPGAAAIQKIVEIGAMEVPNVLYVAKNGDDSNSGKTLGQAFLTLKKALSIATPGTTIFLKSGEYIEDNPLRVPARVSVVGDNLRNTTVRPKNPTKDIFWVYNGAYIFCMNFKGHIAPSAAVCFPPDGSAGEIVTSPYTQAVTSITTTGTGMRVDGAVTTGLRSMVCDAFTQYNQGGIGIHMLNRGNTQLVSIFTICCDISFMCENGGFCSVNLSNSSFGNYGLVSRGASDPLYRGVVKKSAGRQITFKNLAKRPNIGDGVLFANYNQTTCDRDNGLVVDGLAFDLLYEGATQSTFAGLRYWKKDDITTGIQQQAQTAAAIKRAQTAATRLIQNPADATLSTFSPNNISVVTQVGSKTFSNDASGVRSTAKRIVSEEFQIISKIVEEGPISPSLIIPPDLEAAEPEYRIFRDTVLDQKSQIVDQTIKFLKTNYPAIAYVESKCKRDIGLVIDAVIDDMILGTNYKSIKAAVTYLTAAVDNFTIVEEQRVATIEAFKFARDKVAPIVQEDATLLARVQENFAIITNALRTVADGGGFAYINNIVRKYPAQQDTDPTVVNLVDNLQANKNYVVAEVIDYINKNWPQVVAYNYNQDTCGRDIKLSIDAICYDIIYGGNSQTIDAAKRYYNYASGLSQLQSSEEVPATIDAFGRAQLLSQRVVIKDPIEGGQTPVQQVFSVLGVPLVATTQTQVNRLGNLYSIFLKQLETEIVSTSDFIQPNGKRLGDEYLEDSADILQANKQWLKNDVVNYLTRAYPGFDYDRVACARDVGYIVDSVCFDLVHGGNRQAVTAGIYYYDFNEESNVLKSVVPNQIKQTVNAYKYMKELLRDVLTCNPVPNPWQGAVPQRTDLPAATGSEVVAVGNLLDVINEILQEGPNNAEDSIQRLKQPIGLTPSTDSNKIRAFDLLMANRQFIQAEMLAYINQNWYTISDGDTSFARVNTATDLTLGTTTTGYPTVTYQPSSYKAIRDAVLAAKEDIKTETIKFMANSFFDNFSFNKPKCYRDVGLILDAILSDMVFDSNYKTITAAISYLRAYASEVIGAQKVQTIAALKAAKSITIARIVNPRAKEEISTRFDIILDILEKEDGSGYNLVYPMPVRNNEEDIDRKTAVDILRQNIEFIKDEVVAYIDANFTLNEFDREKCSRDTGLIIDALGYDLMFTSNFRSISAGRAYLRANANKVTGNQKLATLGAFRHLKKLAKELVKNNGLAVNSVESNMDIILDILDKGEDAVPKYRIPFPEKGRSIEYKRARDLVEKNRDFILDDVLAYVNTPGLELIKGEVKFRTATTAPTVTFETDGEFSVTYANTATEFTVLSVGDLVRVSGTLFGTSRIDGYSSASTYKISSVENATAGANTYTAHFKLINLDGTALVTFGGVSGRTTGMRFEKINAANYALPAGFDNDKCRRDLSLILDALFYDTTYGGTLESQVAGLAYTASAISQLNPSGTQSDEVLATLRAYQYLKNIVQSVAQDLVWTPTVGNTTSQTRSPNGSDGSATAAIEMGTCIDLILKLVDDANTENLAIPLVTEPSLPDTSWVDATLVKGHELLQAAKEATKDAVSTYVEDNYVLFGYDRVKCRRDVGYVIEAVRYDMMFDSNFRSIVAGRSYYRAMSSVVVKDQKLATLASFQFLKEKLLEIVKAVDPDNPTTIETQAIARVTRSMDIILDILENGLTAEPTILLGAPGAFTSVTNASNTNRAKARSLIQANRDFIEEQTIAYLNLLDSVSVTGTAGEFSATSTKGLQVGTTVQVSGTNTGTGSITGYTNATNYKVSAVDRANGTFTLTAANGAAIVTSSGTTTGLTFKITTPRYSVIACRRDIEYILDAIRYDLTYGGNMETIVAARAYYAEAGDGIDLALGSDEKEFTLDAYNYLADLVEDIATGTSVTALAGNALSQNTTDPGQAADGTAAKNLVLNIRTYINTNTLPAVTLPEIDWVALGIRMFNTKLADTSVGGQVEKLQNLVTDFVDLNFAYNKAKCERDVGFLVDALCYDLLYGGNVDTTQAAIAYFDGAVTPKSTIPKQIIQTVAAYERMKEVLAEVVQLKEVIPSGNQFQAKARASASMDLVISILRDGVGQTPQKPFVMPRPTSGTANAADLNYFNAVKAISANREFLIAETTAYIEANSPPANYNKVKCERDVDLIIDAVMYDLTYGGNKASHIAAGAYAVGADANAALGSGAGELTATVNAFNFLGDWIELVAQGTTIATNARNTKQNRVVQRVGLGDAVGAAALKAKGLVKEVIVYTIDDQVNTVQALVEPTIANGLLSWVDDKLIAVNDALNAAGFRTAVKGKVVALMAEKFPSLGYTTTLATTGNTLQVECEQDIDSVIDAVRYDVMFGSNYRSQLAGNAYYRAIAGAQSVLANQKDASVAVFETVKVEILEKVASYVPVQVRTGSVGNATAAAEAAQRIQDIINFISSNAPAEIEPTVANGLLTWVDSDLRALSATIADSKTGANSVENIPQTITNYISDRFPEPEFTYNVTDCQEDIRSITDAVRYDMMFNSNFRTITAARAYFRAQAAKAVGVQKKATIESFKLLKERLLTLVSTSAVATERVADRMDLLIRIVDKGEKEIPVFVLPSPTGFNTLYRPTYGYARNLIESNREFIKSELVKFIAENSPQLDYSESKCLRDVDFILDALYYDLTYGGNMETVIAGGAYYIGGIASGELTGDQQEGITGDDINASIAAYGHLKVLVERIAQGQDVTDLAIVKPQVRGDAGSVAAAQTAKSLAYVVRNLINQEGEFKVAAPTLSTPNISWVTQDLKLPNDLIALFKTSDPAEGSYDGRFSVQSQLTEWIRLQQEASTLNDASTPATIAGVAGTSLQGKTITTVGNWYNWFAVNGSGPYSPIEVNATAMVKGKRYKIKDLGDITNWSTYSTAPFTASVGSVFDCASVPASGTGVLYEMFTYGTGKCERDIAYVMDAVRYDMMFNTQFRTATAARAYWRQQANSALSTTNTPNTTANQKVVSKLMFTYMKSVLQTLPAKYPTKGASDAGTGQIPAIVNASTAYARIGTLMDLVVAAFNENSQAALEALAIWPKKPFSMPLPGGGTNNSRDENFRAARDLIEANRDFIKAELFAWIDQQKREKREGFAKPFVFDRTECKQDIDLILDAIYYDLTYGGNMETYVAGQAYYAGVTGVNSSLEADEKEATIRTYNQLGIILYDLARNVEIKSYQKALEQVKGTAGSIESAHRLGELVDIVINVVKGGVKQVPPRVDPDFLAGDETLAYVRIAVQEQKKDLQARIADYIDAFILQYNTEKCARDVGLILDAAMYDLVLNSNFQSITAGSVYLQKAAQVVTNTQIGPQLQAIKFIRDQVIKISETPPLFRNEAAIGRITNLFDTMFDIIDKGVEVAPPVVNVPPLGAAFNPNAVNAANSIIANKEFLKEEVVAYITANYKTYDQSRCSRDVGLIIDAALYDLVLGTNYNSVKAGLSYRRATSSLVVTDQIKETLGGIDFAKERVVELLDDADAIASVTRSFELIASIIGRGSIPEIRIPLPGGSVYALPRPVGSNYRDPAFVNAANAVRAAKATLKAEVVAWIASQVAANPGATGTIWSGFTYDQTKCEEDVGFIVDAIAYDLTYGGNMESLVAGYAYYEGTNDGINNSLPDADERAATIAAYTYLAEQVASKVTAATGTSAESAKEAKDLVLLIRNLIDVRQNAVAQPVTPSQVWVDPLSQEISQTLQNDKQRLQDVIIDYVNNINAYAGIATPENYDKDKCRRDVGLVLDAIRSDLMFGTNYRTISAGRSYRRSFASVITTDQNAANKKAFVELKERVLGKKLVGVQVVSTSLNSVVVTGSAGEFQCAASTLAVGDIITITGTLANTAHASITGYTTGKTYKVSATNNSTTFTLVNTDANSTAIVTSVGIAPNNTGSTTGLSFVKTNGTFSCTANATADNTPLTVNLPVRVSGVYGTGAGTIANFSNIATQPKTYYIKTTNGTTQFQLSETVNGDPVIVTAGNGGAASTTGLTFECRPSIEALDEVITQGLLDTITYDAEDSTKPLVIGQEYKIINIGKNVVNAGLFVIGGRYIIDTIGTTDFTSIGAATNTIGLEFTATGAGIGTGSARYITEYDTLGARFNNEGSIFVATASPATITKLTSVLANDDTTPNQTITVASNVGFPTPGTIQIGGETITYTGKNGTTQFTGCTRAVGGTVAAHAIGTNVVNLAAGSGQVKSVSIRERAERLFDLFLAILENETNPANVTVSGAVAATNVFTTTTDHNLVVNDIVEFTGANTSAYGLTEGALYYIIDVGSTTTFKISTSKGGTPFNVDPSDVTANMTVNKATKVEQLGYAHDATEKIPTKNGGNVTDGYYYLITPPTLDENDYDVAADYTAAVTAQTARIKARDQINAARQSLEDTLITWINNQDADNAGNFAAPFSYTENTCRKDIKFILDAIAYDLTFGGNQETIVAGKAYYDGTALGSDERLATIDAYNYLKGQLQTVAGANGGDSATVLQLVDDLISYIDVKIEDPVLVEADTSWVDSELYTFSDKLKANANVVAKSTTDYVNANFPSVVYNVEKCQRDVKLVIDAVRWDMMFNSNFRTIVAARSYYRAQAGTVVGAQKEATEAAFRVVKVALDDLLKSDVTASTRVAALMDIVINYLDAANEAAADATLPAVSTPYGATPNASDIGHLNARDRIEENREYIRAEMNAWLTATIAAAPYSGTAPSGYTADECLRDVELVLDALRYDMTYGGNVETVKAAEAYYAGTVLASANEAHLNLTRDAYARLATIVEQIATNANVTESSGNSASQITINDAGSAVAAARAKALVELVKGVVTTEASTALTIGKEYRIIALGTGTDWNAAADTTGITYAVGNTFVAKDVTTGGTGGVVLATAAPAEIRPSINWVDNNLALIASTMLDRKDSLAKQVTDYIDAQFPNFLSGQDTAQSQASGYTTAKCQRDVKLVIDAVRFDMMFGSSFRSWTAGQAYARGLAGVGIVKASQKAETLSSFRFLKGLLVAIAGKNVTAANRVMTAMNVVIDALEFGPTTRNANDLRVRTAVEAIEAGRAGLLSSMDTWLTAQNYSFANYDQTTCLRDIGYVLDALKYDLTYGGNMETIVAGRSYYNGSVLGGSPNTSHVNATIAAFNELRDQIKALPAVTSTYAESRVTSLIADLNTYINATTNDNASEVYGDASWSEAALQEFSVAMRAQSNAIQTQITNYVTSKFPALVYDQAKCARDVGLIIDAVRWDMLFNSNFRSVTAGRSYWRSVANNALANVGTGDQKQATVAAFTNLKDILQGIVATNALAFERVTNNMDIVLEIIENGVDNNQANPVVTYPAGTNTSRTNAKNILLNNIPFLKDEVISYINSTYSAFEYDEELCSRDVEFITRAVAYDMVTGSNYQTVTAARGYLRSYASDVVTQAKQKHITLLAFKYLKNLLTNYVGGNTAAKNSITANMDTIINTVYAAYQSTVTAVTASNDRFTIDDTSWMEVDMPIVFGGTLIGGVTGGTTYYVKTKESGTQFTISATQGGATFNVASDATGSMVVKKVQTFSVSIPTANVTVSADQTTLNTYLMDNTNVEALVTAGINNSGGYGSAANADICKRDIRLLVQALAFDLTYGGNWASITAAKSYRDGTNALNIPSGEATNTNTAFNAVRDKIKTDTTLDAATDTRINTLVGYVTGVIGSATYATPAIEYPELLGSNNDLEVARNILISNVANAKAKVIRYVNNRAYFVYDVNKCERDIKLILDAVAIDVATGSTYLSVQAGISYLRANASNALAAPQKWAILAGLQHAKSVLAAKVSTNALAVSAVRSKLSVVIDIINDGVAPFVTLNGSDQVTALDPEGTSHVTASFPTTLTAPATANITAQNRIDAAAILATNRNAIIETAISSASTILGANTYNKAKCARDTMLIVEALRHDLLYGGNYAITFVAKSYFAGVTNQLGTDAAEISATASVIGVDSNTGLKGLIDNYAPFSSNSTLEAEMDALLEIVRTTVTGTAAQANALTATSPTAIAASTLKSAHDTLVAAKDSMSYDVLDHINSRPYLVYTAASCQRDVEIVLDALRFDILHETNFKSIKAGQSYLRSYSKVVTQEQKAATIGALYFVKKKVSEALKNDADVLPASVTTSRALMDTIIDILDRGAVAIPDTFTLTATSGSDKDKASVTLLNNKSFIKAEIRAYLDRFFPELDYDKIKCERDVDYILDALRYDLVIGGNSETREAGLAYWEGNALTLGTHPTNIDDPDIIGGEDEKVATVAAYGYLSTLVETLLNNATYSALQDVTTKGVSGGTLSATTLATTAKNLIITIKDMVNAASLTAAQAIGSLTLPAVNVGDTDVNDVLAVDGGSGLKGSLPTDTTTEINLAFAPQFFVYNKAKCARDVGFVVEGLAFDTFFGGNKESREVAQQYAYKGGLVIPAATKGPTVGGFERLSAIINDVIAGNAVTFTGFTVTNADTTNDEFTVETTDWMEVNQAIKFSGIVFGGVTSGTTYYVKSIVSSTKFTISDTLSSGVAGATFNLTNASGTMKVMTEQVLTSPAAATNDEDLIIGAYYKIATVGNTDWNAVAGTTGITYTTSSVIQVKAAGAGTGTAKLAASPLADYVITVLKGKAAPSLVEPDVIANGTADAELLIARAVVKDSVTAIAEKTITFINETYAGFGYLQDTCKRDVGLTLDAVAYDLIYGGNSRTKFASEQYYSGGRFQIPADSKSATVDCFVYLDSLVRKVIKNEAIVTFQNFVDQDKSNPAATTSEVTNVAQLFDAFTDILINGYISVVELDATFRSTVNDNTFATFHQVSTITTTGHTLEWVGTGIDVDSALPYNGGVPKPENQLVSEKGGFINFTSTDEKGDFRIGPDLTIKRDSGSIVGRAFNKSLLGVITPYILALQG